MKNFVGKETIFIFDQQRVYHSVERKVIIGGLNGMRRERKFFSLFVHG